MEKNKVIIESWSSLCNIQAFVEKSNTNYYFYLWVNPGEEGAEIKSCWICNRVEAPINIDKKSMEEGVAPLMPLEYISHDINGMELQEDKLSILWFEEGDGACLLYNEEPLCIIPSYSGSKGFYGYSKYAKGIGPFACEMDKAKERIAERIENGRKFVSYFESDFWPEAQERYITSVEKFFGKYEKYFGIDGGKFPPKALITGTKNHITYGITAGVSLVPMPKVEEYYGEGYRDFRRIELGVSIDEANNEYCDYLYSTLSGIASIPWGNITFLAHGHTIPFNGIKGFYSILLINPKLVRQIESPRFEKINDEDVNFLWVVPITKEEYMFLLKTQVSELLKYAKDISRLHIFDGKCKFNIVL